MNPVEIVTIQDEILKLNKIGVEFGKILWA